MRFVPTRVSLFDDIFDDFFKESFFCPQNHAAMRTDIRETESDYCLDIELPGYHKEDIDLSLDNGILTVKAVHNAEKEEQDKEGNVIRRERTYGTASRSFYVGETLTQEDIKAKYDNGELKIVLPKKQPKQIETRQTITIE